MSYDTSVPIGTYQTYFNNYKSSITNIQNQFSMSYNFGRSPSDVNYHDFWGGLTDSVNIPSLNFDDMIAEIIASSQTCNDITTENFMNLIGMVSQLDNYICFASDSLSRSIDTAWAFGNGSIYSSVLGEYDTISGAQTMIKKGLAHYKSELGLIVNNLGTFYTDVDSSKYNDALYLTNYRDTVVLPEINKVIDIRSGIEAELAELMVLSADNLTNLQTWLPACFRMLTTVSLTFNLGNKIMKIGNKGLIDGSPLSMENRIGMSVAKYWRAQVLADMSNWGDCMTSALLQGFGAISAPSYMEAFIEKTWDNNVPKS